VYFYSFRPKFFLFRSETKRNFGHPWFASWIFNWWWSYNLYT